MKIIYGNLNKIYTVQFCSSDPQCAFRKKEEAEEWRICEADKTGDDVDNFWIREITLLERLK